jgi:hypothetical protein
MLVDEATQIKIKQENKGIPVEQDISEENEETKEVTCGVSDPRVTLTSLTLSDCWLHGDMQQFWVGGDDGCLNWHTFNTCLIPFCLPFSIDHFLFDTSLSSFVLLIIRYESFPIFHYYTIIAYLLKELATFMY